jgi:hypothetical protein
MAKVLISLQDKLIDVNLIKTVEKTQEFSHRLQKLIYSIKINHSLPENVFVARFEFYFQSEDKRDNEFESLKQKLNELEYVVII